MFGVTITTTTTKIKNNCTIFWVFGLYLARNGKTTQNVWKLKTKLSKKQMLPSYGCEIKHPKVNNRTVIPSGVWRERTATKDRLLKSRVKVWKGKDWKKLTRLENIAYRSSNQTVYTAHYSVILKNKSSKPTYPWKIWRTCQLLMTRWICFHFYLQATTPTNYILKSTIQTKYLQATTPTIYILKSTTPIVTFSE